MRQISRLTAFFAVLLFSVSSLFAQQGLPVIVVDHGPNASEVLQRHYVVMVSLDGFRYDFLKKYGASHLLAIAKRGSTSPDGIIPSYPSLTFPNHLALITGLYPEHHGIVANRFYDPERKERYSISDPKAVTDGSWYGGVPLWSLAEKQGMRAACFFWPGSDAEIAGVRPSYYLKFDDKLDDAKRVTQILDWLRLPEAQRPHFLTLYFSNVDHAAHSYGPDSPETRAAVKHVDELIGKLEAGLAATHLPVDLIVVSDHGMQKVERTWITLDKYADLSNFKTEGPQLYPKSESDAAKAYQQLKAASADFLVYRRKDVPAGLNFNSNPREGDPVIVANGPYEIRAHAPAGCNKKEDKAVGSGVQGSSSTNVVNYDSTPRKGDTVTVSSGPTDLAVPGSENCKEDKLPMIGAHGFDPRKFITMRGIFLAEGPDIKSGVTLQPFENVNVYPLVAHILGLEIGKIDGSLNVLSGVLKESY